MNKVLAVLGRAEARGSSEVRPCPPSFQPVRPGRPCSRALYYHPGPVADVPDGPDCAGRNLPTLSTGIAALIDGLSVAAATP